MQTKDAQAFLQPGENSDVVEASSQFRSPARCLLECSSFEPEMEMDVGNDWADRAQHFQRPRLSSPATSASASAAASGAGRQTQISPLEDVSSPHSPHTCAAARSRALTLTPGLLLDLPLRGQDTKQADAIVGPGTRQYQQQLGQHNQVGLACEDCERHRRSSSWLVDKTKTNQCISCATARKDPWTGRRSTRPTGDLSARGEDGEDGEDSGTEMKKDEQSMALAARESIPAGDDESGDDYEDFIQPQSSKNNKRFREEVSSPPEEFSLEPHSTYGSSAPVEDDAEDVTAVDASTGGVSWEPHGTQSRTVIGAGSGSSGVSSSMATIETASKPRAKKSRWGPAPPASSESSSFQRTTAAAVIVAPRSKYQIVHHQGAAKHGILAPGVSDSAPVVKDKATISPSQQISSIVASTRACGSQSRGQDPNNRRRGSFPLDLEYPERASSSDQAAAAAAAAAQLKVADPADPASPSLVVIDGNNVAFSYRRDLPNPQWSPEGILLAIKFFQERGVPVVAFVPRPRIDSMSTQDEHYKALMEAMRSQAIATVPSKGNDDIFILLYAIERDAHIVTNDQFRDHLANASTLASLGVTAGELKNFLSHHHVSYTFVRDEFVANPEAPIIRTLTRQASERRRNMQDKISGKEQDTSALLLEDCPRPASPPLPV